MRRLIFIVSILLLLFCIGWELRPIEKHMSTLKYLEIEGQEALLSECSNFETFISGRWIIEHPKMIELDDTGEITVTYQSLSPAHENNVEDTCKIIIETILEIPKASIKPGFRILSPYKKLGELIFTWNIGPIKQETIGTLWIYSIIEGEKGNSTRVPMFAIPIEIEVISILSLQPRLIRLIICIVSLLTTVLLLAISHPKLV